MFVVVLSDMNGVLWEVLEKACVCPVLMSERFSMEQALLVAILHHHVGTEVGESPPSLPPWVSWGSCDPC